MSPGHRRAPQSPTAKLMSVAILVGSCGGGRAAPGTSGTGGAQGSGGVAGEATAGTAGAGGMTAGAGGMTAGAAGVSGSMGAAGSPSDANGFDATDAGFAAAFSARARAALASGAPSWTCATALPTVPVADTASMRDAVRQFIAQVVGVPAADIMMTVSPYCGTAMPANSCATTFAHDTAKSGGSIYYSVAPLAQDLEANATDVEETIWVPMQNGMTLAADVVMSGISDRLLVGMVVFNAPYACQ